MKEVQFTTYNYSIFRTKIKNMNYRNKYIPTMSRWIHHDNCELDLMERFEMDEVEKFINTPSK